MTFMEISVIICTFNGSKLNIPLNSLNNQNFDHNQVEVLLIDDGSDKKLVIPSFDLLNIHIIKIPTNLGLSNARNTGIELAKGRVVAFTDDDCKCDPNWLKSIKIFFESNNKEVVGMGGQINPLKLENIWERYTHFAKNPIFNHMPLEGSRTPVTYLKKFFSSKPVKFTHMQNLYSAMGLNSAYRSEVLRIIRPDPDMRRGVDFNLNSKLIREGFSIKYNDLAIVQHPHRSTFREFLSHLRDYGEATFTMVKRNNQIPLCYPFPILIMFFIFSSIFSFLFNQQLFLPSFFLFLLFLSFYFTGNGIYGVKMAKNLGEKKWIILYPILELIREFTFNLGWFLGLLKYSFQD